MDSPPWSMHILQENNLQVGWVLTIDYGMMHVFSFIKNVISSV